MRWTRAVVVLLVLVTTALVARDAADAQQPAGSSSLSVFPSELALTVQRGEVVEKTVGVLQTGAPERTLRFEVSGEAAPYVSLVDPADRVTPMASVVAADGVPSYVVVRVAPGPEVGDGETVARVRIVADGGRVAVGSELRVGVQVRGTRDLSVELLAGGAVAPSVEVGDLLRVRLEVEVRGTAPLVPVVAVTVTGPDGSERDLEARPAAAEPGGRRSIEAVWPTAGWPLGRHQGQLTLFSGTVEVGRATVDVEIVPQGSAAPLVTLLGARLVGTPRPGDVAEVLVTARNDGAVDGRVVFVGDLLDGTERVAPLRSEPRLVAPGEVAELVVLAPIGAAGTYFVRGRANLDGSESSVVSVEVVAIAAAPGPWRRLALGAGALVLVAGLLAVVLRRRSRRRARAVRGPGTTSAPPARAAAHAGARPGAARHRSGPTGGRAGGAATPSGVSYKPRRR